MNLFQISREIQTLKKGKALNALVISVFIFTTLVTPIQHLIPSAFALEQDISLDDSLPVVDNDTLVQVETPSNVDEGSVTPNSNTSTSPATSTKQVSAPVAVSVSLSVNGSDDSAQLVKGDDVYLSWVSSNAQSCKLAGPLDIDVATFGEYVLTSAHAKYPTESAQVTYSVECIDSVGNTVTDTVVVHGPQSVQANLSSVDITANGLQGPVTLSGGQPFTLDWISANALTCNLVLQGVRDLGGVPLNGGSGSVSAGHILYPPAGGTHDFVITCNGSNGEQISDLVSVSALIESTSPQAPVISATTGMQCGGNISITWNPVLGATSYIVYRDNTQVAVVTNGTYSDTGLVANSSYSYKVIATSDQGNSAFSNELIAIASAACAPAAVTVDITANGSQGPVVLSNNQSFTLDWISANALTCNLVLQGGRDLGGVELNGTSGVIDAQNLLYPPLGGSHTFVITCAGSNSQTATDSVTVTRPQVGTPPQAPVISATTGTQCGGSITVSWQAVASTVSYEVYRGSALVATTSGLSFTESGLTPGQSYAFSVRAVNGYGSSPYSNTVSAIASAACAPAAVTVDITANGSQGPVVLSNNQSFTLDWISANALTCNLVLQGGRDLGGVELNGTSGVIDAQNLLYPPLGGSHTFVITCAGSNSQTATDSVTVTRPQVGTPPQAPVISATTGTQCGGNISITWNAVSGATSYTLYRGNAVIFTTPTATNYADSGLTSGAYSYTVVASNQYGNSPVSNIATVFASAACPIPPSVSLIANPGTINEGQSSVLTWTSSNAVSCSAPWTSSINTSGSTTVMPSTTTTYTITCVGQGGSAQSSATVTVIQAPFCPVPVISSQLSATGKVGQQFTYTIVANAQGTSSPITFTSTGLPSGLSINGNTISGVPTSEGTFGVTIRATNVCGSDSEQLIISISKINELPPLTVDLVAQPEIIYKGQGTTLSWISGNTVSCNVPWANSSATSGSVVLKPLITTTYSITCTDGIRTVSDSVTVTVLEAPECLLPVISSALSIDGKVGNQFTYTITATSAGTSTVVYGVTGDLPNGLSISGNTISGIPTNSGTFHISIFAQNSCGKKTEVVVFTVSPKDVVPTPPTVDLNPTPQTITKGQNSTLSWTSSNTVSCRAPWTTATSTSGSLLVSPATTTTYTITCTNGSSNVTDSATVTVLPVEECVLPVITSSTTISSNINIAFSYTLSYTSTGTTTTGFQGSLPAGLSIQGNTISGTPSERGTFPITMTVTNPCGTVNRVLEISITGGSGGSNISVNLEAQPNVITLGATSTLSWISSNTVSCSAPWTTATSTSGSLLVSPATTTTYTITCTDGVLTGSDSATVSVIDAPQCIAPNIGSSLSVSGKVGNAFSYTLSATSTATSSISYSIATSTLPEGLSFSGGVISGTPSKAGTYTVQVTATNNCGSDVENLVITIDSSGGGGGGGTSTPPEEPVRRSGGGRGGFTVPAEPEILGATSCEYLKDFLRIDWPNNPVEVIKLQVFLKELEGFDNLNITGVFDQQTFDAVAIFQERYFEDILEPWGHTKYTGFVYILTKKKVNEIVCQRAFPLTAAEQTEIVQFRAFITGLRSQNIALDGSDLSKGQNYVLNDPTTTDISGDGAGGILNDNGKEFAKQNDNGQEGEIGEGIFTVNPSIQTIAAAIFAGPQGGEESWKAILLFLAILGVLFIISNALVNDPEHDPLLTPEAARIRKIFWFVVGLAVSLMGCFYFGFYAIILPLVTLLVILSGVLLWFVFKKKENRSLMEISQPKEGDLAQ